MGHSSDRVAFYPFLSVFHAQREHIVAVAEIAAMLAAINEERALKANARFLDIFNKDNRARTMAASLLAPFTSASGLG
jgi:hypothetical protein